MTKDLSHIDMTRRILQDLRFDREKLERVVTQLDEFEPLNEADRERAVRAKNYLKEFHTGLNNIKELESILTKHLKNMGGR